MGCYDRARVYRTLAALFRYLGTTSSFVVAAVASFGGARGIECTEGFGRSEAFEFAAASPGSCDVWTSSLGMPGRGLRFHCWRRMGALVAWFRSWKVSVKIVRFKCSMVNLRTEPAALHPQYMRYFDQEETHLLSQIDRKSQEDDATDARCSCRKHGMKMDITYLVVWIAFSVPERLWSVLFVVLSAKWWAIVWYRRNTIITLPFGKESRRLGVAWSPFLPFILAKLDLSTFLWLCCNVVFVKDCWF